MALDVILLENSIQERVPSPVVRFYTWKGCWLSIGRNQKNIPKNWCSLVKKQELEIVRRPSGGSAVLHSGGLTYSLIWPYAPRKRKEAYKESCHWLKGGFREIGLPLFFGNEISEPQTTSCFSTSTCADLIDKNGEKRIGSAQLWKQGHLLQHGEILLDPPPQLWEEIFSSKAPKSVSSFIPREGLDQFLYKACRLCWPEVHWENGKISQKELNVASNAAKRYSLKFD